MQLRAGVEEPSMVPAPGTQDAPDPSTQPSSNLPAVDAAGGEPSQSPVLSTDTCGTSNICMLLVGDVLAAHQGLTSFLYALHVSGAYASHPRPEALLSNCQPGSESGKLDWACWPYKPATSWCWLTISISSNAICQSDPSCCIPPAMSALPQTDKLLTSSPNTHLQHPLSIM